VIDLVPDHEEPAAAKARADRHGWLAERGYKIVTLATGLVETDLAAALGQIDQIIE
jgi:very-short-patch-repair endonuclease